MPPGILEVLSLMALNSQNLGGVLWRTAGAVLAEGGDAVSSALPAACPGIIFINNPMENSQAVSRFLGEQQHSIHHIMNKLELNCLFLVAVFYFSLNFSPLWLC